MRQIQATPIKYKLRGKEADQSRGRAGAICCVITYIATVLPLLVIFVLARVYPDLNRQEIPDWRPQISVAEESLQTGDLYQARHLYLQAGRIASWRKDWAGLVAAACGFKRLDGVVGPYSKAFSMLIRATTAAELMQSRRGIATVATAFAAIGSDQAATAVLARIQPYWPDETSNPGDAQLLEACWALAQRAE
jgi:hypothetical protein